MLRDNYISISFLYIRTWFHKTFPNDLLLSACYLRRLDYPASSQIIRLELSTPSSGYKTPRPKMERMSKRKANITVHSPRRKTIHKYWSKYATSSPPYKAHLGGLPYGLPHRIFPLRALHILLRIWISVAILQNY